MAVAPDSLLVGFLFSQSEIKRSGEFHNFSNNTVMELCHVFQLNLLYSSDPAPQRGSASSLHPPTSASPSVREGLIITVIIESNEEVEAALHYLRIYLSLRYRFDSAEISVCVMKRADLCAESAVCPPKS